jgi:hypothetical protein
MTGHLHPTMRSNHQTTHHTTKSEKEFIRIGRVFKTDKTSLVFMVFNTVLKTDRFLIKTKTDTITKMVFGRFIDRFSSVLKIGTVSVFESLGIGQRSRLPRHMNHLY